MRPIALLLLVALTALGAAEPLVDAVFAAGDGRPPAPWRDDSGWADVSVAYAAAEEDGRRFLRLDFTRQGSGYPQLMRLLPADAGLRVYRLGGEVRATPGTEVRIGIRQKGAPWRMLAEWAGHGDGGWRRLDHQLAVVRKPDEEVGLWVQVRTPGALDLARLSLEALDPAVLAAEAAARLGGLDSPNLLRVSRFPLGLPSGWMLDRELSDGDVVQVGTGAAGPSGFPCLVLAASVPLSVVSAPFDCAPGRAHRLSLHAAGAFQGTLTVLEGERVLAETPLAAASTAGWTRVSLAFTPTHVGDAFIHALRLSGRGELRLDGVQVTVGDALRPYAARQAAEVQLALPPGAAGAGRCQFADEPAAVRWCVTGAAAGATLAVTAFDQDGAAWAAPVVTLGEAPLQQGEALLPFPAGRHGALRVAAQVAGRSPVDEVVLLRLPRPAGWGADVPASPFGVHVLPVARHLALVKALGYHWVRLHDAGTEITGWWWNEPERGRRVWFDDAVARFRTHHLSILGQLGSAPAWASHAGAHPGAKTYFARFFQPLAAEPWAAYVGAMTAHHRDHIRHWFVWNEPWMSTRWAVAWERTAAGERYRTSAEPQRDFAALMAGAYRAAKAVDPALTVIGFNSSGVARGSTGGRGASIAGDAWSAGVAAAGGLDACDAIDFHYYAGGPEEGIVDALAAAAQVATTGVRGADGRPRRPLWLTEGAPELKPEEVRTGGYRAVALDAAAPPPAALARRLVLWELGALAAGCERSFLYTTHAARGLHEWPHHLALVAGDGSPHPAALGVAAFHRLVEGLAYAGRAEAAPGLVLHRFAGGGRTVAVAVDRRDGAAPDLAALGTAGWQIADQWGNPAQAGVDGGILLLSRR